MNFYAKQKSIRNGVIMKLIVSFHGKTFSTKYVISRGEIESSLALLTKKNYLRGLTL